MQKLLAFISLFCVLFAVNIVRADDSDVLKDIPIYSPPTDFASAQQIALQNRVDRIAMLQNAMACIRQATTGDDIRVCQLEEHKTIDKIRLSYCDTDMSFLLRDKTGKLKKTDGPKKPKDTSQCDQAMELVTGKKVVPITTDEQEPAAAQPSVQSPAQSPAQPPVQPATPPPAKPPAK